MNKTKVYDNSNFSDALILDTLKEVIMALKERGYNPINQIIGYLISGDPGYISNHKEARTKLTKFERTKILEVLLKKYAE